jgi:hypothetical protein
MLPPLLINDAKPTDKRWMAVELKYPSNKSK